MNLLLDTHIIVCTVTYSSELPRHARTLLENPENTIYYSIASIWEIVVKHAAHSEDFPYTGSQLAEACQKADFLLLEGKLDHILTIDTLEYPKDAPRHKDPFDKLLLAQAKSENMFFVTHDKKFLIIMSPASYLFKNRRQYLLYYPSLHLVHTMDHLHDRISIILRCRPALAARVLFLAQPFHIGGRPLHDIFIAVVHALLSQRIRRSICL